MMNVRRKQTVFMVFFFLFVNYAKGYNLRQISGNDGLSNSSILSICQDKDGFMWFGSCDGLNMFDGIHINVYKPTTDKNNLSGNLIENLIEAEDGTFWVHTNYGLDRFDKKRKLIERYHDFNGKYLFCKNKDNDIFIIKDDNYLFYYHRPSKSFKKTRIGNLKFNNLLNFNISSDNTLWIFTNDGQGKSYALKKSDNGEFSLTNPSLFEHQNRLSSCYFEGDLVYFIDDSHTLYEYNLLTRKKYYIQRLNEEIEQRGKVSSIIKYHNDYFISFQTDGLIRLRNKPDIREKYEVEPVNIRSGIFCLLKDKYQDIIWIGTDGQGVYIYSNDAYSIKSAVFSSFTRNIEKPTRALYLDKEKTLWAGTKGDGILRIINYDFNKPIEENRIEYLLSSNSELTDNSVYSFAPSRKDILWIGTENGIGYYSYKEKRIKRIKTKDNNIDAKYVHDILELNDSTLWLATVGTGILKVRLSWAKDIPVFEHVERFTIKGGEFYANYFFTIFKESDSIIWFGNRGYGAFRLNTGTEKLEPIGFDKENSNQTLNDIFSITKDKNANLWFGTSYGLIKHSNSGNNRVFNEKIGFPNNTIHGILTDSKHNLWLSTNQGIIKFNTDNETFLVYNQANGLKINEFSDGAYYKDNESGILFMGGINGFIAISENETEMREFRPSIYFNNLTIFGKEYNIFDFLTVKKEMKKLELNYSQNFFSVSFTVLDYINNNNYSYFYKLDGLSDHWIDNGSSNTVYFTNIAPGEYTLHIKYKNRVTGEEGAVHSMIIKIRPPWYMSPISYIIYTLLVFSVVAVSIRAFIEHNRRKRRLAIDKLKQEHQEEVYESKLRFFTNIAHEFCTPLTLIHGPCSRILTYKGADMYVIKYTQLIQRNAERLNDLIQELIEFRRIETGNRKPQIESVSVSYISQDIADSFNYLAESKNINYEKSISLALEWNSDKGFLITVITNLISNAFKYTENGGMIKVSVYTQSDVLYIIVSNTGKGIKEENIGQLFDRYSILDDLENRDESANISRNGLGLAISYSMIKLLGGNIEVRSKLNDKTDFIVSLPQIDINSDNRLLHKTLPAINIKRDHENILELPKYIFDETKLTILIIDDELEMLWFISEIFAAEYNVICVNKATEVNQILTEVHPNIIISDIMMPELDGITLTKEIKSNPKTAHIPMILVSAKHRMEEQIEGITAGAEMYITKPFNIDYLKISIKQLITKKEALKDYFSSPLSAFELTNGKLIHKDHRKFVQKILDVINKNITNKDLSTQFIADKLNMSSRHLSRKLREIEAKSSAEMIKECRLYIARGLLLNTTMTIDEIIYKSGYSNRGPFFKAFADKYGCTPKEYRDKKMSNL